MLNTDNIAQALNHPGALAAIRIHTLIPAINQVYACSISNNTELQVQMANIKISLGDSNALVSWLQDILNIKRTSIFDVITQKALLQYQKQHNIPITGILDNTTILKIIS